MTCHELHIESTIDCTEGMPSICITKKGDVWLGGHNSRELLKVDITGKATQKRTIKNRPTALAVMDSGAIIISPREEDSRSISKLLTDDNEKDVYHTSETYSHGVSVTPDQKILICTHDGRLMKVNNDGTQANQIYNGGGINSVIHAVEDADGNVYISDILHSAVKVVFKDDRRVLSTIDHTTDGKQLRRPCGLLVDKFGNILCADNEKNCVYIIDQNQKMRELVGPSYGIKSPTWLAVDNHDNLWITQEIGRIHIVKYLAAPTSSDH